MRLKQGWWSLVSKGIELEGFDELLKATEELGRKGARIENEALRETADFIVKKAKQEADSFKRTGALKDSMQHSNVKTKNDVKVIEIGSDLYYFNFIENGTSKMASNPFLTRTFEANKNIAYKMLERQLKLGLGL